MYVQAVIQAFLNILQLIIVLYNISLIPRCLILYTFSDIWTLFGFYPLFQQIFQL